jgi:hypothetical protein
MPPDAEPSIIVDTWSVDDGSQAEFMSSLVAMLERLEQLEGFGEAQIFKGVDPTLFVSWTTFSSPRTRDMAFLDSVVAKLRRRLESVARPSPNAYELVRRFTPKQS